MGFESFIEALYNSGIQHITAVTVSLIAAYIGLRLSFQFGGEIGKALRWFSVGLLLVIFPHTIQFLTVTYHILPLDREPEILIKTIFYTIGALFYVIGLYLLKKSVASMPQGAPQTTPQTAPQEVMRQQP